MTDLGKLRDSRTLRWNRWTVFRPGQGTDGTLYSDDGPGLSLDVWTAAETAAELARRSRQANPDTGEHESVAIVADPRNLDELHEAVRTWCRDTLGRDDVEFTVRAPGGTLRTVDPAREDS